MTRSRFQALTEQANTVLNQCAESMTRTETRLAQLNAEMDEVEASVYTTLGAGEIVGSSTDNDGETILTVRHSNGQTRNYYGAECA